MEYRTSVPNVWQIEFSNVPFQDGVIHPNIHGFFDGPSHVIPLPAYNFEVFNRFKNILVSPKDKDSMTKKKSVIYSYSCGRIGCDKVYTGESSRTSGERFKEHLKAPSPIYDHQSNSCHTTSIENFNCWCNSVIMFT